MRNSKTMALGMLIGQMAGGHPAAWLHPEANAHGATDIDYFPRLAQEAERGLFDLFFIGDTPAARTDNLHAWSRFPMFINVLEPVTLLTAKMIHPDVGRFRLGSDLEADLSDLPLDEPIPRERRPKSANMHNAR
ncbi:MAG: hypothetical protein AB7F22_25275 [Reyranella sp.]|uniref:hypothetical protein n=1 Tax=Reyranella sp. TaxID=1929291 RepID=UPI003D0A01DD